jgi:hypothetical protein
MTAMSETPITGLLDRNGPDRCEAMSPAQARAWCLQLTRNRYENFPVLTSLVPAAAREDFAAIYAFCRWADDLGTHCKMYVETHRYAVAAMPETNRSHFFVRKIGDLLIPKMAKASNGEGDIILGKSSPSFPLSFSSSSSSLGVRSGDSELTRGPLWRV